MPGPRLPSCLALSLSPPRGRPGLYRPSLRGILGTDPPALSPSLLASPPSRGPDLSFVGRVPWGALGLGGAMPTEFLQLRLEPAEKAQRREKEVESKSGGGRKGSH